MAPLSTAQKALVKQFTGLTNSDKKQAETTLKSANWNLSSAVDLFFSSHSNPGPSKQTQAALNKIFDAYRDDAQNNPDTIQMSGTMSYFRDIGVNIEDISLLVASELLACPSLGDIPRTGFTAGWGPLSATTIQAQQTQLSMMARQLNTPGARAQGGLYRRVYKHTFRLACPAGSKSVPLETATEFWKQLFGSKGMPWVGADGRTNWLDMYVPFLEQRWKKAVNKDLWDQTLLFAIKTLEDGSLSWWSEDSAWPGIIDEFVASVQEGRANGDAMDVE